MKHYIEVVSFETGLPVFRSKGFDFKTHAWSECDIVNSMIDNHKKEYSRVISSIEEPKPLN